MWYSERDEFNGGNPMYIKDTICAITTAKGYGAVGIIRLSGEKARHYASLVYLGKENLETKKSHSISYGFVKDKRNDRILDEALFILMDGPRSFTGEDVVEIQSHGGMVVLQEILELLLSLGVRHAEEGEFTKRAFLNGKMDLSQAEAIMDIVDAKTGASLDLALSQRQGKLKAEVESFREALLMLTAYIQADLDYPEDDIERLSEVEMKAQVKRLKDRIDKLLSTSEKGRIYKNGLKLALVGKPNVGKSSLLNQFLGYERAIVTDVAGTTRDVIVGDMIYKGVLFSFYDTAGIRDTEDRVEKIGIELSKRSLQEADAILYIVDKSEGFTKEDTDIIRAVGKNLPIFYLANKIDEAKERALFEVAPSYVSAKTGEGIGEVLELIYQNLVVKKSVMEDFALTSTRHIAIFKEVSALLSNFYEGMDSLSYDLLVIDLQSAWEKLGLITGATSSEDLLDVIFKNFCLGK